MLRKIPVGAGHDFANVGVVRTSGPDLLASDDPFVTVFDGLGGERCKVGTCTWLREQLRCNHLAAPELLHIEIFCAL